MGSDRPPKYERAAQPRLVDGVEAEVRALLVEFPRMAATVIAGADRLGPLVDDAQGHAAPDPARVRGDRPGRPGRLSARRGHSVRSVVPETPVPVAAGQARVLPVLVMTLAFSRFVSATMLPSRQGCPLARAEICSGARGR